MMPNKKFPFKSVLITGGTGYIGLNLISKLLKENCQVHLLVRYESNLDKLKKYSGRVNLHFHDGSSIDLVRIIKESEPDIVYHLASLYLTEHNSNELKNLLDANVLFSTQLVDAMVYCGVSYFVNTGSSWQFSNKKISTPVNLYAATKQAFESVLDYYIDAKNLKVTTLYLFDTYGPNDHRNKLISNLWRSSIEKSLLQMSPGEQFIDLVYIDDVVDAYLDCTVRLIDEPVAHSRYGISSGKPIRLIDLVGLFVKITGCQLNINWGARPYRSREVMVPWAGYVSLPDWEPKIDLQEGLLLSKP